MRRVQFVPGLIVSALGLLHPAFRRVDGSFEPVAWAVVVGGGALAIAGIAWGSQWKRFGILFATALMGHACAVQLIFAPPYSVYQRVYPWEEILGSWKIVFLAGLLMQTVVTLWAFGRWWPDVQGCWQDVITRRRLFVLCGIMAVVQVYVTEVIVQYVVGVILGAWIAVVAFLNLAVVAAEIPPTELQKAREWVKTRFGLPDEGTSNGWRWDILFPWGASAWVTMVAAILAWGVLEGIPHVPDSMSYIFQAKYFALGRLYMPAPPDAASFAVTHIVNDGTKWFAYGFPGWPAVLALGVLVGFPWVVNPILGGLSILLIHKILSELYGKGLAHAVIGLLAVSPWFLFTSASFMAHSASLLWALLAIRGVQNARRAPVRWGTIAGLALGMLFLTRPLEGILVGGVIGLWALWLSGQPVAPRGIAAIVVAGVFLAILAFPYNKLLTGSATYPPHVPDSMSYIFQAKYFALGRLYMPAPPDAASFAVTHIVNDGTKWFAYGFPGWPAVLALGVLVGFPWVVNPILGGLSILLIHKILSELYGKGLAHAVIGLLAVSPWFLFTSASFMAHSASLLWALLAIRGVQNARRAPVRWGTIAGLALGMLFLTRPLEGILVGGVIGLWALWLSGQPVAPRGIAAIVVAGVFLAILAFPYNKLLTGSATYPPHMKWTDEAWYPGADRLGFGPNIGNVNWPHLDPFPGHGLLDVVVNAKRNLYMSNFELFGWGFGSLGFVWVGLLLGGEWRREDWLFLAIILSVVGGHSLYWSSGGPDFGARYWYQALIPFIVLTVRGVQMVQARCRAVGYGDAARRMTAFVGISCVVAFVNVMPWRSFGKYYHYRGMSAQINRLAEQHEFGKSLVLIQSRAEEDYPSAFVFNPPTLDGPTPIYARDAGPTSRAILRERYKDREVWILGKTRSSGGEFRILAGPLPSGKTAEAERRPSHGPGPRDEGF